MTTDAHGFVDGAGEPGWSSQPISSEAGEGDGSHPGAAVLRARVRQAVSEGLAERIRADEQDGRPAMDYPTRRTLAERLAGDAADAYANEELTRPSGAGLVPDEVERRVVASVLDEVFGMGGLQPLLANEDIENVNVNGCDRVFVRYADGRRAQMPPVADSDEELIDLVRSLAARSGVEERRFDRGSPGVNVELPDGSRMFAVMAVTGRPSISIRRHRFQQVTLARLRSLGTIDAGLEALLAAMVRARFNVLVVGGTAIGKTTMLRGLASAIPPAERLITIEDNFELGLDRDPAHPDVIAMQAREANVEGAGAISQAELVRWALRMSPDRVIVGEVRGAELVPMANAMSQGNDGSMATLHASTSRGAFTKLATYAAQSPERLGLEATNLLMASALHFVVHVAEARDDKTRVVSSIREVVDADEKQIISNEVYRPDSTGRAVPGVPLRTETVERLAEAGFDAGVLERTEGWWRP
ncbi:Flp pilus assembly complex ATPase component TadA [Saccharopolyspora sp. K220]|uniref:CpaF family protein n=1 Tax=Saccharopolyspora soli TaxID=2926618 RepID=UPI001F579BAB|nr:ATPase, T2SS/T4P/T4SS family [Saccharopolyspora soli]MCI2420086.1 Flp pilus assembly complex ATPase component TadA [Saccharopolyspora soli]